MKFKDLVPGEMFEIVHAWKDIPRSEMMKVVGADIRVNAVYINWRRGTLDYVHADTEVVSLGSD